MPGDIIAAAGRQDVERGPGAEFAACHRRPIVAELGTAGSQQIVAARRNHRRRRDAGRAIAVEVDADGGLEGLQRIAGRRDIAEHAAGEGAAAVGRPDGEVAGRRVVPDDIVAAAGRQDVERDPIAELAACHRRPIVAELGTAGSQQIVAARRNNRRRRDAGRAIAVEILTKQGLGGFQRVAVSHHRAEQAAGIGAGPIDGPDRVLRRRCIVPSDIVAARRGHRTDGRPAGELARRHRDAVE